MHGRLGCFSCGDAQVATKSWWDRIFCPQQCSYIATDKTLSLHHFSQLATLLRTKHFVTAKTMQLPEHHHCSGLTLAGHASVNLKCSVADCGQLCQWIQGRTPNYEIVQSTPLPIALDVHLFGYFTSAPACTRLHVATLQTPGIAYAIQAVGCPCHLIAIWKSPLNGTHKMWYFFIFMFFFCYSCWSQKFSSQFLHDRQAYRAQTCSCKYLTGQLHIGYYDNHTKRRSSRQNVPHGAAPLRLIAHCFYRTKFCLCSEKQHDFFSLLRCFFSLFLEYILLHICFNNKLCQLKGQRWTRNTHLKHWTQIRKVRIVGHSELKGWHQQKFQAGTEQEVPAKRQAKSKCQVVYACCKVQQA